MGKTLETNISEKLKQFNILKNALSKRKNKKYIKNCKKILDNLRKDLRKFRRDEWKKYMLNELSFRNYQMKYHGFGRNIDQLLADLYKMYTEINERDWGFCPIYFRKGHITDEILRSAINLALSNINDPKAKKRICTYQNKDYITYFDESLGKYLSLFEVMMNHLIQDPDINRSLTMHKHEEKYDSSKVFNSENELYMKRVAWDSVDEIHDERKFSNNEGITHRYIGLYDKKLHSNEVAVFNLKNFSLPIVNEIFKKMEDFGFPRVFIPLRNWLPIGCHFWKEQLSKKKEQINKILNETTDQVVFYFDISKNDWEVSSIEIYFLILGNLHFKILDNDKLQKTDVLFKTEELWDDIDKIPEISGTTTVDDVLEYFKVRNNFGFLDYEC